MLRGYITPNDEKCRMVKPDLRHYIKIIISSFEFSKRTPHSYAIVNVNNLKSLKYIEFDKTIKSTLQKLETVANDENFITFVGFETIRKLKL